ncbi:MAG: tyrosine-type recombinase/integrase [Phototrophicaceae bacterium]
MADNINLFQEDNDLIAHEDILAWENLATSWLFNFNSAQTRANYRRAIQYFFKFCMKHPQAVTQNDILQFRYDMDAKEYSQSTINQRLAALSSFYSAAVEKLLCETNPVDGVRRKAINPYGKATFLEGEQDLELLATVDRETIKGKRDYAILLIFLTTAVRVDAVARLRMHDFRQQGNIIYMQYMNKGGEVVEKKLQTVVVEALIAYLDTRPDLQDESPVFIASVAGKRGIQNLHGEQATEKPLSSRSIQRLVQAYANKAYGKGHGITPHSLRHTAAMNAITSGASVIEVSRLLRHKNMRVTTIYVQHVSDKADEAISEKLARRYLD